MKLTDTRLVVWGTSFWLGRPNAITGQVPLADLHDVAVVRHGMVTGLALVFRGGAIVEVEALRGHRLRRLGRAVRERISDR